METKKKYLLIGAVLIGGYLLYKNLNADPAAADTGTGSGTGAGTDAAKLQELQPWLAGISNGAAIQAAAVKEGSQAVTNVYNLVTKVWNVTGIENYPFTIGQNLQPSTWDNSIGQWWVNFVSRNALQ